MGNSVIFWHDCWCDDQSLKVAFPVLYENAINKEALVESLLMRLNIEAELGYEVSSKFNDWELESVADFLHLIVSHSSN